MKKDKLVFIIGAIWTTIIGLLLLYLQVGIPIPIIFFMGTVIFTILAIKPPKIEKPSKIEIRSRVFYFRIFLVGMGIFLIVFSFPVSSGLTGTNSFILILFITSGIIFVMAGLVFNKIYPLLLRVNPKVYWILGLVASIFWPIFSGVAFSILPLVIGISCYTSFKKDKNFARLCLIAGIIATSFWIITLLALL
jgi:hypothetical protein